MRCELILLKATTRFRLSTSQALWHSTSSCFLSQRDGARMSDTLPVSQ